MGSLHMADCMLMGMKNPPITPTGHLLDKLVVEHDYSPHYQLEVHAHVPSNLDYFSD